MASTGALAARRGRVEAQLADLTARLGAVYPAAPAAPERYSKDPQIAGIEQLEYLAAVIEAVLPITAAPLPIPPPAGKGR